MTQIKRFTVLDLNTVGILSDPFEFDGDGGLVANATRKKVFDLVVSQEALTKHLEEGELRSRMPDANATNEEVKQFKAALIEQAIKEDQGHGPTLLELIGPDFLNDLARKQSELGSERFTVTELDHIQQFVEKYGSQKFFYFLRNGPAEFLCLDKQLRFKASNEGKDLTLPILSSPEALQGQNAEQLKTNLLDALFAHDVLDLAYATKIVEPYLKKRPVEFFEKYFGEGANLQDFQFFCSPAGQTFFYWLYQAINLHLISEEPGMIQEVNDVKEAFANTIGNPAKRAQIFKENVVKTQSGVVFTQESDAATKNVLTNESLFLPVEKQIALDGSFGSFVFLRSDLWEEDYHVIPVDSYEGYHKKINIVVATLKETREKFLLASCHGNSTKAEDGRFQIDLVAKKFQQLQELVEQDLKLEPAKSQVQELLGIDVETKTDEELKQLKEQLLNLELLIGIDANTKEKDDMRLFNELLAQHGLAATAMGPTTIKRRMVSVQHDKVGRLFAVEEDRFVWRIAGRFQLKDEILGFSGSKPDVNDLLPTQKHPFDHFPLWGAFSSEKNELNGAGPSSPRIR